MDNRAIVYKSRFKLGTSRRYIMEELRDEENMKEYIASQLAHDLVKWLIENDYVQYKIEEGSYGCCNTEILNIVGEVELRLTEVPKRYNKKVLVEKLNLKVNKLYNKKL